MRTIAERTFSVREAADYAGVSIQTIRRWIKEEKLKATRVGGLGDWKILKSDIEEAHSPQNCNIAI